MLNGENGVISGTNLDNDAASKIVTAVIFSWGGNDPSVLANSAAYVANTTDLIINTFDIGTLTAMPELEVDMNRQGGGSKDDPITIKMKTVNPIDKLKDGKLFQPIWANVIELDPSKPETTTRQLYYGKVGTLIFNKNGRADVVEFKVNGNKYQLDKIPIGMRAQTTCPWTLGDKICDFDLITLQESPDITNIVGRTITVNALTEQASRFWERGWFQFEKMFVGIRKYTGGLTFETYRAVSTDLIGETILLSPGCDKTVETCIAKFNNVERFGGFGYAIPAYAPIFENG